MTERLTERFANDIYCKQEVYACDDDCFDCPHFRQMIVKLAHYEDLEEQGRLVVLPEEFDRKRLLDIIADLVCPRYVGLEDWGHDEEKCPSAGCNECWETALKIK